MALLAGCAGRAVPATLPPLPTLMPSLPPPAPASLSTPAALVGDSQPAVGATASAAVLRRSLYLFTVVYDYDRRTAAVSQVIRYVNTSSEPLKRLLLVVEPNRVTGAFVLQRLLWADGSPVKSYRLEGARLEVPLLEPLAPGAMVEVGLGYDLLLPERAAAFGFSGRQANFSDWYPIIPPYRPGEGWLAHEPAAAGEHMVYDVADYQVRIRLLGNVEKLLLAAGTQPEEVVAGQQYLYRMPAARQFSWSVGREYTLLREAWGDCTVNAYVFPEHSRAGQDALHTTVQALSLYSELYGAYPRKSMTLVEADFPDGMEYDGLYFLGKEYFSTYPGGPLSYLIALSAHETAHQWWFARVGSDQARQPWLDEALATYSEYLFYQRFYPGWERDWWVFRVHSYEPEGKIDGAIDHYSDYRQYVNAVYLRGALFLHELRQQMGDEAFLAFLGEYAREYDGRQAQPADFFALLRRYNSGNLDVFLSTYFENPP